MTIQPISMVHAWGTRSPELPAFQITMNQEQRRLAASAFRIVVLVVIGAVPVLTIPAFISGVASINEIARFVAIPSMVVLLMLAVHRSAEARWALHGLAAGLIAVTAYDSLRMPFVWSGVFPDFIPRLGGWIGGDNGQNALLGYLWRYLGDGGGMGLVFFIACSVIGVQRASGLGKRAIWIGVGYGIFVWSGLIATITIFPAGSTMLFALNPKSFAISLAGHLVYGSVLGLYLRRTIRGDAGHRTAVDVRAVSETPRVNVAAPTPQTAQADALSRPAVSTRDRGTSLRGDQDAQLTANADRPASPTRPTGRQNRKKPQQTRNRRRQLHKAGRI